MIINGSISVSLLYLFVVLLEITEIFFHSSMSAILPSIVSKDELIDANSTNSLIVNIGQLLAPVIASIIYAAFGLKIILIVSSISFLLSALSKFFLNIPVTNKMPEKITVKTFKKDLMEGFQVIKENKFISAIMGIGTIINFSVSPLFAIGVIFIIKEVLKTSDFQFGLFQSIFSLSMIVSPLVFSGYIKKNKIGKLCFNSFLITALLIFLMALVPAPFVLNLFDTNMVPFILLLAISFVIGMFATVVNIVTGTLFNQVVPLELMGRTSTVFNLLVTVFIPIGQMLFGYLYDIISPSYVILLNGIIIVLALVKYKSILMKIDDQDDNITAEQEDVESLQANEDDTPILQADEENAQYLQANENNTPALQADEENAQYLQAQEDEQLVLLSAILPGDELNEI
jgi:MFS family permease